ncbi:hypothetical protein H1R20_g15177, partial [Candolleomyces eurysporus]
MEHIKKGTPNPWDSLRLLELEFGEWSYWPGSFDPDEETDDANDTFKHLPPAVTSFDLRLPDLEGLRHRPTACLRIPEPYIHRFTTLRLELNWEATAALKVLEECVDLETLIFDFRRDCFDCKEIPYTNRLRRDGILLPKLRTLRLEHASVCDDFLRFLRTPSLSELDLSFEPMMNTFDEGQADEAPAEFGSDLVSFIQRSQCALRRFRIHYLSFRVNYDKSILDTILSCLPTLTHLTLDTVTFDGEDFWLLEQMRQDPLPNLEVFELLNVPYFVPFFDPSYIAGFIDASLLNLMNIRYMSSKGT